MNTDTPPKANMLSARCPSRRVLDLLADKWVVLVIAALSRGVNRNGALLREIGGISQKMLTQTLRALEYNGLVQRIVHDAVPPHVEYRLTPLGDTLINPIHVLGAWVEAHFHEVERARQQAARAQE